MSDIKQRLLDACNGHPAAKIPWPHRLLHEAAERIALLEKVCKEYIDMREEGKGNHSGVLAALRAAGYLENKP